MKKLNSLNALSIKAFGKLNLMLDIVGRRDDGYHMLETVMQSVDIYDRLDIFINENAGGAIDIACDKKDFPCDSSNLIWKAVTAFRQNTGVGINDGISVTVEKNLPSMAGMAGGSADCAAMLHGLNKLYDTNLSDRELCEIGVKLGADVPFCLMGGTRMCRGIGEKMEKLNSPQCCFVVVKPIVSVSTPEAFKKYDKIEQPKRCDTKSFLSALEKCDTKGFCKEMFNVLDYACNLKEIEVAKEKLKELGAVNSLMTGSGSAVFGIFENENNAQNVLTQLKEYEFKAVCHPVSTGYEVNNFCSEEHL